MVHTHMRTARAFRSFRVYGIRLPGISLGQALPLLVTTSVYFLPTRSAIFSFNENYQVHWQGKVPSIISSDMLKPRGKLPESSQGASAAWRKTFRRYYWGKILKLKEITTLHINPKRRDLMFPSLTFPQTRTLS